MFKGLFSKVKNAFKRTREALFDSFLLGKKLDPQAIAHIEEALYGADFGVETTQRILDAVAAAVKADPQLHAEGVIPIAEQVLTQTLRGAQGVLTLQHMPEVIALVGINGAGKTTTAAKLAYWLKGQGKKVTLGACDTFRAAAGEQIKAWSDRLGIDLVGSQHGGDSAAVAYDAYVAAKKRGSDVLILDTAGRLHTKMNLLEELKKLHRVLQKHDPRAPHHIWLVVDGSLGSNSIAQAKAFHDALGLTGLIITKLDGTSRGGALVGIYEALKIPIYFTGLGEQPEDLQPFEIGAYLEALLSSN